MSSADSFQALVAQLQAGDPEAGGRIVGRFAHRLISLARSRLNCLIRQKLDPEDVVQSVFRSFFVRQADGRISLEDWDSLWAILTVITLRKCAHRIDHFRAARRDVHREVSPAAAPGNALPGWEAIDREPTAEEVVMLAETVEHLMERLTDRDRRIVELKLQGETASQIGAEVGCSENTVGRVLQRARKRLERMVAPDEAAS